MDPIAAVVLYGAGKLSKPFLERALGPSLDAVGQHWGNRAKEYLAKNLAKSLELAEKKAASAAKEIHEIPMRTAIPLLEGASREDDPEMQQRWAALIASAATASQDVGPVFASTLSELTPRSAAFLEQLHRSAIQMAPERETTSGVGAIGEYRRFWGVTPHTVAESMGWFDGTEEDRARREQIEVEVDIIVQILIRQALIEREPALRQSFLGTLEPTLSLEIGVTSFGGAFLRACASPTSPAAQEPGKSK